MVRPCRVVCSTVAIFISLAITYGNTFPVVICRGMQPTRQAESVFKAWWVGLGYKIFFDSESGWVCVIKFQTRQTQPDPPIYLILYIKNII